MILIPGGIPGWIFGLVFILVSFIGIKSQRDNIGHEAHLGGGIIGLLVAIVLRPEIISTNTLTIALILIPTVLFIYLIISRPGFLLMDKPFSKSQGYQTIDDKYNAKKVEKQNELNKILEKINKRGYDKLTDK